MINVIDAHVHWFFRGSLPAEWYRRAAFRWAFSKAPPADPRQIDIEGGLADEDGQMLVNTLKVAGVDRAVCMSLDFGPEFHSESPTPDDVHARFAALHESSGNLIWPVGAVDPRREDAVAIVRRCVAEYRLCGLKLYPPSGYSLADSRTLDVIGACAELALPIVIHSALSGFPHPSGHLASPMLLTEAQSKYPEATFVLAHAGWPTWIEEALIVAESHPHTYLEFSAWHRIARRDPDWFVRFVLRARDRVGSHRLLFGSDHVGGRRFSGARAHVRPWLDFWRDLPAHAARLGATFDQSDLNLVLGLNASRVFGTTATGRGEG